MCAATRLELPTAPQADRVHSFTAMRLFAALLVVVHHFAGPAIDELHLSPLSNVVHGGFTSVGFFFVLSGFVLARGAEDEFHHRRVNRVHGWCLFWLK